MTAGDRTASVTPCQCKQVTSLGIALDGSGFVAAHNNGHGESVLLVSRLSVLIVLLAAI